MERQKNLKWVKLGICAVLLIAIVATVIFMTGHFQKEQPALVSAGPITIQVVHTNDIHGRYAYAEDAAVGFERLLAHIKQVQPDLILDAGDTFHGQAFATLEQGESIAQLMKAIGYDAMTPGNHDWNYGKDRLVALAEMAGTKVLAANVTEDGKAFFGNDGTLIKTIDGIKIGVVGVYDPDIKSATAPINVEGLTFTDDAEAVSSMAKSLREQGCDVVIALSHQLRCDEFIKKTSGIDVLIAGHEHAVLDESYPDADGKQVRMVETGAHFGNVGLLNITFDKSAGGVTAVEEALLSAQASATLTPDATISTLLTNIGDRQKIQLTKTVGATGQELDGSWETLRVGETSMGRIVTAAYLKETGADVAFENAGGIRLGRVIAVGDITYRDVIDTAPFGNYIVTKQVTGEALISILEKSIDIGIMNSVSYKEWLETGSDKIRWPDDNGNYLQFGGMDVTYNAEMPQGQRVGEVLIKGEPLNTTKLYTVVTNNYISLGKTYSELAGAEEINQYGACDEALQRFIEQGKEQVDAAALNVGVQPASQQELSNAA